MNEWVITYSDATELYFFVKPNQNSYTEPIITLIEDPESRWDELLANSQDILSTLADEALIEYREGSAQPLMPDEL